MTRYINRDRALALPHQRHQELELERATFPRPAAVNAAGSYSTIPSGSHRSPHPHPLPSPHSTAVTAGEYDDDDDDDDDDEATRAGLVRAAARKAATWVAFCLSSAVRR